MSTFRVTMTFDVEAEDMRFANILAFNIRECVEFQTDNKMLFAALQDCSTEDVSELEEDEDD